MTGQPRLLVLRAIGLGDFLTGVPALRMLRTALPAHHLVLAAPGVLGPLVELCDAVDEHLPTAELAPPAWTGRPPDVAVDLHGNGPASKRLLQELRPGRLVAFGGPGGDGRPVGGPAWAADEPEVVRWCRLVEEAFGETARPDDVSLRPPSVPSPAPGAVVVHPGAAYPSRRWPADRYAEVARHLAGEGVQVVLTGTAQEADLAEDVRRRAGLRASSVLAGRLDLGGLAALVSEAALVVCGDTGVGHLATAYSTPSVLLFGPTSPAHWGPPRPGPHTVLWHGEGRGDPHGGEVDPALMLIGVGEVVAAARSRLPARPHLSAGRSRPGW